MKVKTTWAIAMVALIAAPVLSRAESKSTNNNRASAAVSSPEDAKTLAALQHANVMEIEMGKLAKSNGKSEAVKAYGDTLVDDHQKAEDKTEDVAKQLGVKLPDNDDRMAGKDHEAMMKLKSLKGAAFDTAFVKSMAEDHAKDIATLEKAQSSATGPVAQLISDVLPVLKKHAQIANQLVANPNAKTQTNQ